MILSFTKNKSNFESILKDNTVTTIKYNDHSLEGFFNEIHDGLEGFFDKEEFIPSRSQLKGVSIDKLKRGVPEIFDEEIDLIFNRKQKLFDIYENDIVTDLSINENFMEYFFDDMYNIPSKKQVLLRRMLLGLTSYYPIDRSSIVTMPQVVKPNILPLYKDYNIVRDINIVPCFMSSIQWINYELEYSKEKTKKIQQLRRKDIYNDKKNSDYNIRTRQNCNIVYEDDTFRVDADDKKKESVYQTMTSNGHFSFDKTLNLFSPKFYQILENIQKFTKNGTPTGKILYYSDFRHDAGSEVFEWILIENGYERFDSTKQDMDELISKI